MTDHGSLLVKIRQARHLMQRRLILRVGLYWVPSMFMVFAAARVLGTTPMLSACIGLAVFGTCWAIHLVLKRPMLSELDFLLYLNRTSPDLEESAQLMAPTSAEDPLLHRLQREKIKPRLLHHLESRDLWLPALANTHRMLALSLALTIAAAATFVGPISFDFSPASDPRELAVAQSENNKLPTLLAVQVDVTPPAYTGLSTTSGQSLNIEALENSEIRITASFSDSEAKYELLPSGSAAMPFVAQEGNDFVVTLQAERTMLFQFAVRDNDKSQTLDSIYTVSVTRDKKPAIRILDPKSTTLEFSKTAEPVFQLRSQIQDDFGIAETQILASVAKGTGEAVKFRDEVFSFEKKNVGPEGDEYIKNWDLRTLGMEPGDELYFAVVATDNRAPEANTSKSATVIIRWLDEEENELAADGIVTDFVPEYFKSQRQIIIETEQLIADGPVLNKTTFKETSYGLGQAQSDLKQRYGQYLGDEFGEGPGEQLSSVSEPTAEHGNDHDDHEGREERPDVGHDHGETTRLGQSREGASELVAKFGHAHEEADIGPIAKRDPKTLMKKAVNEMWQAELHLMLAEPEKALPFEYEALKFLKLAKQADRIYVKRLGFEPPPVSEEKRLTGELKDIQSRSDTIREEIAPTEDQVLIQKGFIFLNENNEFTDEARAILQELSVYFVKSAEERPAFIAHAAAIEKILLSKSLTPADCRDCKSKVQAALWGLLSAPVSAPQPRRSFYFERDPVIESWVQP